MKKADDMTMEEILNFKECVIKGCFAEADGIKGLCKYHKKPKHYTSYDIAKIGNPDIKNYIYFMYAKDANRVKIGRTLDIEERFKNIQAMSPIKLEVIKIIQLHVNYEDMLHEFFKEDRLHGEWFNFSDDIKAFIEMVDKKGVDGVINFFVAYYGELNDDKRNS